MSKVILLTVCIPSMYDPLSKLDKKLKYIIQISRMLVQSLSIPFALFSFEAPHFSWFLMCLMKIIRNNALFVGWLMAPLSLEWTENWQPFHDYWLAMTVPKVLWLMQRLCPKLIFSVNFTYSSSVLPAWTLKSPKAGLPTVWGILLRHLVACLSPPLLTEVDGTCSTSDLGGGWKSMM